MRTETSSYRPYGEQSEGVYALNVPEAKGYIGERLDADAGLQYLNARYYDPRLGMFLQPDWWEVTQAGVGTNRYSYSFGDPVNGKDPTGHCDTSPGTDGCTVTDKEPMEDPKENDPERVAPDDVEAINGHAIYGDGSKRVVDFSEVEIKDLGGSIQKIAADPQSQIQKAARQSLATGKPVRVKLTDVIATKNMSETQNSANQAKAIGRFAVDIEGQVTVDNEGRIHLSGKVTGMTDKQDYVSDPRRDWFSNAATKYGRIRQWLGGGKDFNIDFGGSQSISVDIQTSIHY